MERIKRTNFGLLIGLVIQYILGMYVNLFITFPDKLDDTQMWEFTKSQIPLLLHVILGLALFINSIVLIIFAFKYASTKTKIYSIIGFLFLTLSFYTGESFITNQSDIFSYLMSLGFIGSFVSYLLILKNL